LFSPDYPKIILEVKDAIMTYTQPEIDTIPSEDIETMAKRIEAAAQEQVAADIACLKAMGKPIHYAIGEKLVREEANGQKFEIEIAADGNEKIIGEIL
jgi:hypothetical protein